MSQPHIAKTSLAIRASAKAVFEAFIDPEVTTKFWFTHSSGKLEEGKSIEWVWAMYQLMVPVTVIEVVENQRIVIKWGEEQSHSTVIWDMKEINENLTFLTISNTGFKAEGEDLILQIADSTKGFSFVLAGLKAWLEHGIQLNLVDDSFPKEMRG